MSQNKNMKKDELIKQSQGSESNDCSLGEEPSLLVPDLGRLTSSFSGSTDSPSPPPPTASNSDVVHVADPSSPNNTSPGVSPDDTGKKGHAQEIKDEMFPSPCEHGEPMRPQHLLLDFTPKEGDDDAYNVKKVLDFWKFIRSVPGLDSLRASPEDWDESENSEDITHEESENDGSEKPESIHITKSDKSAIPWIKRNHMISTAFAARQRGKYCEKGGGDYYDLQPHKITKKTVPKPGKNHSSSIFKRHSEGSGGPGSSQASAPQNDVHTLCKQLDEWDHFHPSTLEPPATPPKRGYSTAVLQRKT